MRLTARVSVALIAVLATAGCYTSHVRTQYVDAGDLRFSQSVDSNPIFEYDRVDVPVTNHIQGKGESALYEHRLLEIPSVGDNNQPDNLVTASYYRSIVPGSHPLVIVLPIWGTYTYPPRKMSKFVQNHAYGQAHVLHMHGERYFLDWDRLAEAPDEELGGRAPLLRLPIEASGLEVVPSLLKDGRGLGRS